MAPRTSRQAPEAAPPAEQLEPMSPSEAEMADDAPIMIEAPEPPKKKAAGLTQEDLLQISELITEEQIDALVRMKAKIHQRDEYRRQGIAPSSHVVATHNITHMYKGKNGEPVRKESKPGEPLLIKHFDPDHLAELRAGGHVESPV